ncbi:putative methyltransferase-domain-containing protein [Protomyces lactucae-debilis]|uniref:Putative methyltransferase-domain-containing protein n=1 Tax=Protomyces lactucae-debilis TaxID=2754530 RepID=A0A1Y2EVX4_PROLT|nr:putative methyltransferase-domain-containing protein [Protomyces lactucae-debilis]ORY75751.1 putative methyltransferase-domain-containing protein [Protomyces lactucae-debilis]
MEDEERRLLDFIEAQFFQHVPSRSFSLAPSTMGEEVLNALWQQPSIQSSLLRQVIKCEERPMPTKYTASILKLLLKHLERLNAELDDELVQYYTDLLHDPQAKAYPLGQSSSIPDTEGHVDIHYLVAKDSYLTISEQPNVLAQAGTTGHRTWSAALALGEYLLKNPHFIQGKRVLELGGGTGFLSLLCERLHSMSVCCTDGSPRMLDLIRTNIHKNNATIQTQQLLFGGDSPIQQEPFDVVLGADITYETGIVAELSCTLDALLHSQPEALILIAATVRQERT